MSSIESIYLAASHGATPEPVSDARLEAGVGLCGDRYAGDGIVSLIEQEEVEAFNAATGLAISGADTGRNLVTRGLPLNDLVGRTFRIGDATLEGTELCEPCATLGRRLATDAVSAPEIVRQLTHKAGIRAKVLSPGSISPGSTIEVP